MISYELIFILCGKHRINNLLWKRVSSACNNCVEACILNLLEIILRRPDKEVYCVKIELSFVRLKNRSDRVSRTFNKKLQKNASILMEMKSN